MQVKEIADELYSLTTGTVTFFAIEKTPQNGNPAGFDVVVLGTDGVTVAYRYSTDNQDELWEVGNISDLVDGIRQAKDDLRLAEAND